MMRIALTGSPGVGKTTLAQIAREEGWQVIDLKAWAHDVGAVVGHDDADGADVIDVDVLTRALEELGPPGPKEAPTLIEGHLSHLLPVDRVWVVRVDPDVLGGRLEARGYPPAKVRENLEAEALDLILMEALDGPPGRIVVQRDGTRRSPRELWKAFADATFDSLKGHDLEAVDWSGRLPL